ncbi:MAG: SAF domain-containing protein [Lachnospiraceae bacterium]|nr:SAF domain-containing protein [Lachnospiraceae bacterium]
MKNQKRVWIGAVSAVLAAVVFIAILRIQTARLEEVVYKNVVMARQTIAEDTTLTESNIGALLEIRQVPEEYVPEEALSSLEGLEGCVVTAEICAGSILTQSLVRTIPDVYGDYGELFWISVSAEQLTQAVAGTLRAGDVIDLYCVENGAEGVFCSLLQGNVRVERVLTKSGEQIANGDVSSLAQLFVIPMEREDIPLFYEALYSGSLMIARCDG